MKYIIIVAVLLTASGYINNFKAMSGADSIDYENLIPAEMLNELSPEERKQLEDAMGQVKEMKDNGMLNNIPSGESKLSLPTKQDKILSEIPSLTSQQQYNDYLTGLLAKCTANIDPVIISEVDEIISKNGDNTGNLVNIGQILLMQKKPVAAIYAAIKIASQKPEIVLLQNNMAVILHQTGNPQISVPILHYLVNNNNYPLILNNLAQSYLSLGDTASARNYFISCLQKEPDNSEANCGMGLILSEEGNISDATPYVIKALKNGYSETADEIMKKHTMNIKFSDIKIKVPEYFNPQKYKPVPPADNINMVISTQEKRKEADDLMRLWMQKAELVNTEQNNKIEGESLKEITNRIQGFVFNSPFAKKSQLMMKLLGIEFAEYVAKDLKNLYLPRQKEYYDELEKQSYGKGYSEDDCKKQIEYLNSYLQKSAKNHEAYQREALPEIYEWANQSLYWMHFLNNEEQYKAYFASQVSGFFQAIHGLGEMQSLYPLPAYIATNCQEKKKPTENKTVIDSLTEPNCPVKIAIPMGVAKVKWDCKTFEIEGGELIMGGLEKDFKSGEVTLFIGLGAEFYGNGTFIGGVEAGGKIGSFVKLGRDLTIIDMGNKGEIGIEGGIGPFINETKLTGVMGMQSGVTIDKTIMGETKNIYNSNPPEVQINPEIQIFNK